MPERDSAWPPLAQRLHTDFSDPRFDNPRDLATSVAGELGGKVGVSPRPFLKKLVADVLDRIDQFEDLDPRVHYRLTVASTERDEILRATSADDVEL